MEDFTIHCVFDGRKGEGNFNEILKFALHENVKIIIRPFSHDYEEDKDEIRKLPAFHIFYKGEYEMTFYPGDCPKATIQVLKEKPVLKLEYKKDS
jgi:hypothetical protein